MRLGSLSDPERRNIMTNFNVMLLLAAMSRLPRLTMIIDDTKTDLENVTPFMPDNVKDFFLRAHEDKVRTMGKGQASAVQCPKPKNSVLFQGQKDEAYPTESRMKQKAKHVAEKELTGEKHKPNKKLVHIEPGYDDCGEDDSSILEDTGDVYWTGDIPSIPGQSRKKADILLLAFLTEFEGEYNPRNRLFGSEVYGCYPTDAHRKAGNMDSFLYETCREGKGGYTDVFELCVGSARVSMLLDTRKHITK